MLEIHIKKANLLLKEGRFPDALSEINSARTPFRSLDAMGSPPDYYAGLVYDGMKNNEKALESYKAAYGIHPRHIAILNNLGRCYFTAGDLVLAENYYLKALDIVPGFKETRVNLSTLYYKKGNYEKSLEMLQGLKGTKKEPAIRQNIKALNELLGRQDDNLERERKHHEKMLRKAKKHSLKHAAKRVNEN